MEVDEEEAWLNERTAQVSSEEAAGGDTLAAVQELLKKHDVFEMDLDVHRGRVGEKMAAGRSLVEQVGGGGVGGGGGGANRPAVKHCLATP